MKVTTEKRSKEMKEKMEKVNETAN